MLLRVRQKVLRIELGCSLEQHTSLVALATGRGEQGPSGVTQGEIYGLFVGGLVL